MALFWLLAGMMIMLAAVILTLPWLRTIPRLGPLPAVPWPVTAGAGAVLILSVGLYWRLGRPDLADRDAAHAAASAAASAAVPAGRAPAAGAGSMSSAIAALQARLAQGGGSAEDWELLAKSYDFLGRPADAARARARQLPAVPAPAVAAAAAAPVLSADSLQWLAKANAARRDGKMKEAAAIYAQLAARGQMSADGWADYADIAATLQGRKLAGQPEAYIASALALDPRHPKALWLKASADEEAGRLAAAVVVWQHLLAVLEPDSSDARIVAASLQQDMKLAGTATASPPAPAAPSGRSVTGEVALAPALRGKAGAGTTLFIVAKSVDSPGMPVAVLRSSVGSWPVRFALDDSQSMIAGRNLSGAGRVTVEARISRTGEAMPATGDLLGSSGVVNPADREPLRILIDRVVP